MWTHSAETNSGIVHYHRRPGEGHEGGGDELQGVN